jgi:hypothetical protein
MRPFMIGAVLAALLVTPALACGPASQGKPASQAKPHIPPLAAVLDELLPNANLSEADSKTVRALRAQIKKLAAARKEQEARKVEEQAMEVLGYRKAWLRCGPGTFMWMKKKASS